MLEVCEGDCGLKEGVCVCPLKVSIALGTTFSLVRKGWGGFRQSPWMLFWLGPCVKCQKMRKHRICCHVNIAGMQLPRNFYLLMLFWNRKDCILFLSWRWKDQPQVISFSKDGVEIMVCYRLFLTYLYLQWCRLDLSHLCSGLLQVAYYNQINLSSMQSYMEPMFFCLLT